MFYGRMVPPRPVAEAPRNLLPRVTSTSASTRLSTSSCKSSPDRTRTQRHLILGHLQIRKLHILNAPHYLTSSSLSPSRARPDIFGALLQPSQNANTSRNSVEYETNPIKYNGVYVAAVKSAKRAFHATGAQCRDHHFDTLKFVQRLKDEGFSEEQATAMMRVLNDVIQESIQNLTRTMALREGK